MHLPRADALLLYCCSLLLFFPRPNSALSWGFRHQARGGANSIQPLSTDHAVPQANHQGHRLSNMFTMALNELQELESEPLCHRIAARLLVNNCHLLDGQDEATVHLDSGRAARDFVDSYAASLAICDLERGSFAIPSNCFKFREPALAALPVPKHPHLHVSTPEIDNCLEGLAQSDSAWNTWVSYRHKALRFCEVARAENEKDQSIHLHKRVTKILERLASQIELELEKKLQTFSRTVIETAHSVDSFAVQVDQLGVELGIVMTRLHHTAAESTTATEGGLEVAKNLQLLLTLLLRTTMDATAEVAASHETALQVISKSAKQELEILTSVLSAALASSASLQHQIDATQIRTKEILQNQADVEAGMEKLEQIADDLLDKFGDHEGRLDEAQRKAAHLLETLDAVTVSATSFGSSIFGGLKLSAAWPYIICPVASLIMGSYRLEPSIGRNLWLVGIGEMVGFLISSARHYADAALPIFAKSMQRDDVLNRSFDIDTFSKGLNNPADVAHLRRNIHSSY
ncbi:hypothetical protein B0T10DRAFT_571311 [Thelonectria olida]|uniref:Nuclear membrane fusion protein Kar5 n=1 Tax=Thelonectria olida TaxID=1576542 RepID=A0A9P8WLP2_9HYPO|nr:hypothetical protein B0T10DRAFT_571311 [Thelonectria olida]